VSAAVAVKPSSDVPRSPGFVEMQHCRPVRRIPRYVRYGAAEVIGIDMSAPRKRLPYALRHRHVASRGSYGTRGAAAKAGRAFESRSGMGDRLRRNGCRSRGPSEFRAGLGRDAAAPARTPSRRFLFVEARTATFIQSSSSARTSRCPPSGFKKDRRLADPRASDSAGFSAARRYPEQTSEAVRRGHRRGRCSAAQRRQLMRGRGDR
jgi:hypothetical protein